MPTLAGHLGEYAAHQSSQVLVRQTVRPGQVARFLNRFGIPRALLSPHPFAAWVGTVVICCRKTSRVQRQQIPSQCLIPSGRGVSSGLGSVASVQAKATKDSAPELFLTRSVSAVLGAFDRRWRRSYCWITRWDGEVWRRSPRFCEASHGFGTVFGSGGYRCEVQSIQAGLLKKLIVKCIHGRMIRAIWLHLGIMCGFEF